MDKFRFVDVSDEPQELFIHEKNGSLLPWFDQINEMNRRFAIRGHVTSFS